MRSSAWVAVATCAAAATISVDDYPQNALEATAWSLIYTYPLAIFASWAGGVVPKYGVNNLFHQRRLATPDDGGVIKPNVDTLYTRVVLDLSHHDLVLTIPEVEENRYWLYPLYDPFGQVVAEVGAANGNKPGRYLIRRAEDVHKAPGIEDVSLGRSRLMWQVPERSRGKDYQGIINMPGSYGTMLIRLLLLSNTTADLDAVHAIQDATSLVPLSRGGKHAPWLNSTYSDTLLGIQTPEQQLQFAAKLVPHNPPIVDADRDRVSSILSRAGLHQGSFRSAGVNLTAAAALANASIEADIGNPAHIRDQGNSYQLQTQEYQGFYGTNYAAAAYVALAGYQQLTVKQTLYPGFQGPVFSSFYTLPPNGSWLFTFSGKPRIRKPGFWSLSIYGADQNLIKNALNRFEMGDRTTSLVYEDGTAVYGANASDTDGPFQILLQDVNTPPPANWTSNWLPAEQSFFMLMRWYFPEPAMTDGSYVYPHVQNISAIVA